MKARFEQITYPIGSAFNIIKFSSPYLKSQWHFHSAYEIVYIQKGHGKLIIGNIVGEFKKDDLVFLGPNLPHAWLSEKPSSKTKHDKNSGVLIQFKKDFIEEDWLQYSEFKYIKEAIDKSHGGIKITGESQKLVVSAINKLVNAKGIEKITLLIQILNQIGSGKNLKTITDFDYLELLKGRGKEKLETVFNYVLNNYLTEININKAASLISMNESAFCRYFKTNTNKTFMQVVNEMRIGYACSLLKESSLTISQICYESGFNNMSNFLKHFKNITSTTPSNYRDEFLGEIEK